jgi:aryl-alcohol dehydrogenase-like predicted oxidoreductase
MMDYTKVGTTALNVSRYCLGCVTHATLDRGNHAWTLDESTTQPILGAAVQSGIDFFDTPNVYSDGTSEVACI